MQVLTEQEYLMWELNVFENGYRAENKDIVQKGAGT